MLKRGLRPFTLTPSPKRSAGERIAKQNSHRQAEGTPRPPLPTGARPEAVSYILCRLTSNGSGRPKVKGFPFLHMRSRSFTTKVQSCSQNIRLIGSSSTGVGRLRGQILYTVHTLPLGFNLCFLPKLRHSEFIFAPCRSGEKNVYCAI